MTKIKGAALLATALACGPALAAGTWQTTLQPRDLDPGQPGIEAWYDTVLDVTWLADWRYAITTGADADGRLAWANAMSFADALVAGGKTDWRLPTVNTAVSCQAANCTNSEISHLWYVTLGNQGRNTNHELGPFTNLPADMFWTATKSGTNTAWAFSTQGFGSLTSNSLLGAEHAMAFLRSGDTLPVPEPAPALLLATGLGVLALRRRR